VPASMCTSGTHTTGSASCSTHCSELCLIILSLSLASRARARALSLSLSLSLSHHTIDIAGIVRTTIADEGTGLPVGSFSLSWDGHANSYAIGAGALTAHGVPFGAPRTVSLDSITPAEYRLVSAACTSDGPSVVTGSSPAPGSSAPSGSVTFNMAANDELNCVFTVTGNLVFCVVPVYYDLTLV
jgi:hypothetical protein